MFVKQTMGAGWGCSSPLKRLGGKRGKHRRDSSSEDEAAIAGSNDNPNKGQACQQQPLSSSTLSQAQQKQPSGVVAGKEHQHKFIVENENTIHSEINEDHPSTASFYTDGKNHNEDGVKFSEHSTGMEVIKSSAGNVTTSTSGDPNNCSLSGGSAVARIMGFNGGSYVPHDRHLLVSPALSPAPSTCYSPSPALTTLGSTMLDLNDLNEAFKTLTFGMPNNYQQQQQSGQHSKITTTNSQRIKQLDRHNLSDMHNYYTQQLVQTPEELIKHISVIFITTDTFQSTSLDGANENSNSQTTTINTDTLASVIESNLKTYCDENLFNLRFIDLSHKHLSKYFHINNLLEASLKILEQEHQENSQQTIIILLSNINSTSSSSFDSSSNQENLDKRQLPSKIEAQTMNKLQAAISQLQNSTTTNDHDLLKRWYNQLGNTYYLNPIYLVYPKILNESMEERDHAWQSWLTESNQMIKLINQILETNNELNNEIKLESFFSSYLDYIINEPTLQKRTLLIRNYYSQPINSNLLSSQQQSTQMGQIKDSNLNELARLLSDPNKLTLKRFMNDEEFTKTINDWVLDNFSKYIESFVENQIISGKQTPPFIEKNLFIELTRQRHCLEHYLDNSTENFESKCRNFYNSHILPILNDVINYNNQTTTSPNEPISNNNQQSANHLVFMSGPKGCGKSSLFAQIIKLASQDTMNKAQIIYRFCGITRDSMTPNRLLRNICEQFCQTQGENITAASYIYSARKDVMNSLNKIVQQQTSLLFIDGLNIYNENNDNNNSDIEFDWLCELESNPRIKVFITLETDSELYKKALGTYTDATYISLDYPSITEWAQMLTSTARSKRFNSATSLYDEIKNLNVNNANLSLSLETNESNKLTHRDFSDIINMCRIRKLNNEFIYPELSVKMIQNNPIENFKNVHQVILKHLHYLMTPYQLCSLLIILNSCRNGLSEFDIINIMTLISQSKSSSRLDSSTKFSSSLLNYLKIQLKPWLIYILCDKTVKIKVQRNFLSKSLDYYITNNKFTNIIQEVHDTLLEYFARQSPSSSKSTTSGGKISETIEQNERIKSSELLWLATQASEMVHLLIKTNPSKAKEHILNKHQFYNQFLYNTMPEEFVEDYEIIKNFSSTKKNSTSNEELQTLVNYIRQSIYPLRYDGAQIYSQIYCRAIEIIKLGKSSKYKRLSEIINLACCPPKTSLLPVSEISVNSFIKTRIGLNQPPKSSTSSTVTTTTITTSSSSSLNTPNQTSLVTGQKGVSSHTTSQQSGPGYGQNQVTKQKIYTIKDNHRHVIVIYPDKCSLSVWDIFEEKAVRTINNLDQPRDLRMIDQRRAVILCNRELRVYDLDSGHLLNKLKGVMNQKMPFFEVYGENYVVALARNRMYVNMLNLNTGELETTFKVGEDRFLNSLLVSANGGICVCGDETQKPFPLLVWNLNERRLLYDLRLDKHEFLTRMSAISDDGHFVVSVCKQVGDDHGAGGSNNSSTITSQKSSTNFIVIYDLNSGTLFKKWKPGVDSCGVAISLAPNKSGKVINCIVNNTILIWDLATGSKRYVNFYSLYIYINLLFIIPANINHFIFKIY